MKTLRKATKEDTQHPKKTLLAIKAELYIKKKSVHNYYNLFKVRRLIKLNIQ